MSELSDAIKQALSDADYSYRRFADLLADEGISTTKDTVALWATGRQPPRPQEVFAMERVFGVRPGTLSALDGYIPVGAKSARSVVDAIEADRRLDTTARRYLRAVYDAAIKSR